MKIVCTDCLSRQSTKVQITCLDSYNPEIHGEVNLNFISHFKSEVRFATRVFAIRRITSNVPHRFIHSNIVNNINDFVLADSLYFEARSVVISLAVNVNFTLFKGKVVKR